MASIGPGAGAYMLPSTVGFDKHDVSRYRNPQYTMGHRLQGLKKSIGPGPQYDVSHMTMYGKESPPAYSLRSRPKGLTAFQTPAPGTYSPEKAPRMKEPRPPAYSMAMKLKPLGKAVTPGPNQYQVPTTIGPKVPDLHANAAYSMGARGRTSVSQRSPGPAQYPGVKTDIYKNKHPQYSIGAKIPPLTNKTPTPGPAAYNPRPRGPCMPGFSFGHRTVCRPYITADDHMPCINK